MNIDKLRKFLAALGISEYDRFGDWLRMRCPMAWRHEHGDANPSFSILINDEGSSFYYCFGCEPHPQPLGRLIHALWIKNRAMGRDGYPTKAAGILAHASTEIADSYELPDGDSAYVEIEERFDPIPKEVIRNYPLLIKGKGFEARRCTEYLAGRGISAQTFAFFKVRYHKQRQALVFPFTGKQGEVFALRLRHRKSKTIYSVNTEIAKQDSANPDLGYEFISKRQYGFWFGLAQVHQDDNVILVEAEIDAMRLFELGFTNVLAAGGVGVTRQQIKEITATRVILGFDADKGGKEAIRRVGGMLQRDDWRIIQMVDWSVVKGINGIPCKDAGDLPDGDALKKVFAKLRDFK